MTLWEKWIFEQFEERINSLLKESSEHILHDKVSWKNGEVRREMNGQELVSIFTKVKEG